ncbi:hypothetical protein T484DRAFT_2333305 [Baffinella frigidus]|nr:hypothetical protein T484DRAFT_2333305 [Cryptophyta sp. CCMP2293]
MTASVRAALEPKVREELEEAIGVLADAVVTTRETTFPAELAAIIAWSCSVLEYFHPPLISKVMQVLTAAFEKGAMDDVGLRQTHQFLLSCSLVPELRALVEDGGALSELKDVEKGQCLQSFLKQSTHFESSALQRDVGSVLSKMTDAKITEEFIDETLGYSIDLFISGAPLLSTEGGTGGGDCPGVAVEVDGPFHFLKSSERLQGRTIIKRQHLACAGYRVVSVPYWSWDTATRKVPQHIPSVASRLIRPTVGPPGPAWGFHG